MFRHLKTTFFETWFDDRYHYAVSFDISLNDIDLPSRSQLFEKVETSVLTFLQISLLIWMERCYDLLGILPLPVCLCKLMLNIYIFPRLIFMGENSYLDDFIEIRLLAFRHLHANFFKFSMMIDTNILYTLL